MTRIFALRLRGFLSISASVGIIGFFVYFRKCDFSRICPVSSSIRSSRYGANIFFTRRSSSEWNVITRIFQPILSSESACLSEDSIFSNSSFSAIRSAWKTRIGDFLSKLDCSMRARSLWVVSIGVMARCCTIACAMNQDFFSSP